jgi:3-oxoacyl-[acyl-carrier-protein] synthase III
LKPIYISAINYVLGEPHPLTELSDPALLKLAAPEHGLVSYLSSDQEIWQLAAAAGKRTIEAGPQPDLLIYVSENEAEIADALPLAVGRLGLGTTEYVSVAGHGCGNLGPALRVARDALYSGQHDQVLLILADRVLDGDRSMINGLSVLSDGAASCLVTREAAENPGGQFKIEASTIVTRIESSRAGAEAQGLLSIVSMAVDGVQDALRQTELESSDFSRIMFANYRLTSQRFLAKAMGFPGDRLLLGRIAEFAHCFSADILITLDQAAAAGEVQPGERVLASATGRHSWSMLATERVA